MKTRPYCKALWRTFDSEKSLVLICGPRQCGKTSLAKSIAAEQAGSAYLNYDVPADKVRLVSSPAFFEALDRGPGVRPLVVLDEIHKYKGWKNYLKGLYDGFGEEFRFLVTGSGRLDLYQQRGDALAGRFRMFHMFPFTMGELNAESVRTAVPGQELFEPSANAGSVGEEDLRHLLKCSGFPEPFLRGSDTGYRRWAASYHRQIVRSDIRDAFAVRDIDTMELLYNLLAARVAAPLSLAQLMDPLKTSHKTISAWVNVFEKLMLVFRIRPYSRRVTRSVLKEPKLYFYDYGRVQEESKRYENLVAVELKRAAMNWTDYGLGEFEVRYLRNKEHQEVDFLMVRDGTPAFMVEVKSGELEPTQALLKFQSMLHVPAVQIVRRPGANRVFRNGADRVLVTEAASWLARLR